MKDRKIYSAFAALTLLSATVTATASTGTINFTGNVTDATCTVTGLNQTLAFENKTVAEMQPLSDMTVPAQVAAQISIADCPSSISKGKLSVSWQGTSSRLSLGNTTMRGAAVAMGTKPGTTISGIGQISSGAVQEIILTGGAGSTTIYPSLFRTRNLDNGAATVVAGDFAATAQLTMAYE